MLPLIFIGLGYLVQDILCVHYYPEVAGPLFATALNKMDSSCPHNLQALSILDNQRSRCNIFDLSHNVTQRSCDIIALCGGISWFLASVENTSITDAI